MGRISDVLLVAVILGITAVLSASPGEQRQRAAPTSLPDLCSDCLEPWSQKFRCGRWQNGQRVRDDCPRICHKMGYGQGRCENAPRRCCGRVYTGNVCNCTAATEPFYFWDI